MLLKDIADELEDRIEMLPGVLSVEVTGGVEREIRLEFDSDRLAAYNIDVAQAIQAVAQNNLNMPSGSLELGEANYNVKVPGEFQDPAEIDNIVIDVKNGKPVYLLDVARVVDGFEERATYSRLNGRPTVTLAVVKRSGSNIVRLVDSIRVLLGEAEKQLPAGVYFSITNDQSKDIRMMVADLENNLISGLILITVVVFFALGVRDAILVSLAIPFSMLITFATLQALGITLNMIVLFSLTLALGMLVDNAIVIVENIHRQHNAGLSRLEAAHTATAEVAWPITTSAITTICAFFPMLFWPGIMGEFMSYLPKTVIITLAASLLVALVITPPVASVMMKKKIPAPGHQAFSQTRAVRRYSQLLRWALRHRWTTVVFAFGTLVLFVYWYACSGLGTEFFPDIEPARGTINIKLPEGSSLDASDVVVRTAEAAAMQYAESKTVIASTGGGLQQGGGLGGGGNKTNESHITIEFVDREDRRMPSSRVLDLIRNDLGDSAGAEIQVDKAEEGPPTGKPIAIEILGDDFEALGNVAAKVRRKLKTIDGVVDVKDDYVTGKPELSVLVDKEKAALFGLTTQIVGQMIRTAIQGSKAGVYRVGNDEYDVVVRMPKAQRQEVDTLERLRIPSLTGAMIPLSSVADFQWTSGLGAIQRVDERRTVTVTADAGPGYNANALLKQAKAMMADFEMPATIAYRFTGQDKEQKDSMIFLAKAFIVAILLIGLVLVGQFDSLVLPFIILTSVILSLIGVFMGLIFTDMPFGIVMTGIGVISLAGVVVNNAIVLIDYMEKLRARGMAMMDAVVQASTIRFRPVMLTAITTILGLVPMATGVSFDFHKMMLNTDSESSEWWVSMAVAVIFGLGIATLLTLVVVPCLYVILEPLRGKAHKPGHAGADADQRDATQFDPTSAE